MINTGEDAIAAYINGIIDSGALAGAVALVWRGGKVVYAGRVGWQDIEAGLPTRRDTIFRIASMSKPVTTTAALMLLEEGRFALDEPITRWAPEFGDMRVLRSPSGPLDQTDPAARPVTFDDLLTHRSGLTYSSFDSSPISQAYDEALGGDIDTDVAPDDWIARLGALPLIDQPGAGFHYGHSTDLLGLLVARMDGVPLGDVLARRIFGPLGMADTGFTVPAEKRDRRAQMYGFDHDGTLTARPTGPVASGIGGALMAERPDDLPFVSGGQGLWSTVDDYLAFARMFIEGGSVGGVRLLRPETLALMTTNRLTDRQRAEGKMLGMPVFTAHGFGMGVAVVMDPEKANIMRGRGGIGTVSWAGAYGGWWQADPTDSSVMVFLAHNVMETSQIAEGIGLEVFGAITQFHTLASAMPGTA